MKYRTSWEKKKPTTKNPRQIIYELYEMIFETFRVISRTRERTM